MKFILPFYNLLLCFIVVSSLFYFFGCLLNCFGCIFFLFFDNLFKRLDVVVAYFFFNILINIGNLFLYRVISLSDLLLNSLDNLLAALFTVGKRIYFFIL